MKLFSVRYQNLDDKTMAVSPLDSSFLQLNSVSLGDPDASVQKPKFCWDWTRFWPSAFTVEYTHMEPNLPYFLVLWTKAEQGQLFGLISTNESICLKKNQIEIKFFILNKFENLYLECILSDRNLRLICLEKPLKSALCWAMCLGWIKLVRHSLVILSDAKPIHRRPEQEALSICANRQCSVTELGEYVSFFWSSPEAFSPTV